MKNKKIAQQGFHLIPVIVVVVVIAVIGLVALRVMEAQKNRQNGDNDTAKQIDKSDPFMQQYGANCDDMPQVSFTHSPLTTDQLGYIEPMGRVSDSYVTPTDHVYLSPLNPKAADNSYNVVMPANGKVVEVQAMPNQYVGDRTDIKVPGGEYRLIIAHSCRYFSLFIHIHKLSDKIMQEVGDLPVNTSKKVGVLLKAGDPLGTIGGSPIDWTLLDTTAQLSGLNNPALYQSEPWKVHTIDPLSLFTGSLKDQLEAKSLRSSKPYGGKIDYDQKTKLIGTWFRQGTKGYIGTNTARPWDGHLAIIPNHIDPSTTVVSIGNWDGRAAQFAVKGKVDPATITKQNSPVKLELTELSYLTADGAPWVGQTGTVKGIKVSQQSPVIGTIIVEPQDGEKLKIEKFIGKTAAQVNVFTGAAEIYER